MVLSFYEALISEIEIIKFVYSWRFKKFKVETYNFLDTESSRDVILREKGVKKRGSIHGTIL